MIEASRNEVRPRNLEAAGRDQGRPGPHLHAVVLRHALRRAVGAAGAGQGRRSRPRPQRQRRRAAVARALVRRRQRQPRSANIACATSSRRSTRRKDDDRVKAVALDLDGFTGGGQTAIGDLADAVRRVRGGGQAGHRLCRRLYQRQLPARLGGIRNLAQPARRGARSPARAEPTSTSRACSTSSGSPRTSIASARYKSAVEPFIRNDMSPEAQAELHGARPGRARELAAARSSRRGRRRTSTCSCSNMNGAIAAAGGDMAKAALANGLVDRIGERSASSRQRLAQLGGKGGKDDFRLRPIKLSSYVADKVDQKPDGTDRHRHHRRRHRRRQGRPGHRRRRHDRRARSRTASTKGIKALVVRVDSPGGSVLASERIRQARACRQGEKDPDRRIDGQRCRIGRLLGLDSCATSSMPSRRRSPARSACSGSSRASRARSRSSAIGADGVKTTPLSGEPDVLQGPLARSQPADPDRRQFDVRAVPQRRRRGAPQDARSRSTRSPRAACGTAAPRTSLGWSTASAGSTMRSPRPPQLADLGNERGRALPRAAGQLPPAADRDARLGPERQCGRARGCLRVARSAARRSSSRGRSARCARSSPGRASRRAASNARMSSRRSSTRTTSACFELIKEWLS